MLERYFCYFFMEEYRDIVAEHSVRHSVLKCCCPRRRVSPGKGVVQERVAAYQKIHRKKT